MSIQKATLAQIIKAKKLLEAVDVRTELTTTGLTSATGGGSLAPPLNPPPPFDTVDELAADLYQKIFALANYMNVHFETDNTAVENI